MTFLAQILMSFAIFLFFVPFIVWIFIIRTDVMSNFTWGKWKVIGYSALVGWILSILVVTAAILIFI